MWATDSFWFEVPIVSIVYAIGNIVFGHFAEQTSTWRRVAKYILTLIIIITLSYYFGRTAAMIVLSIFFLPLLCVHGYFLPKKKGINGLTGEPKSKYYDFRKWDKNIFREQ